MNNYEEKRDSMRVNVSCEVYCKLLDTEERHTVLCVTLSGNGISFISEQPFEIGAKMEMDIAQETMASHFFITIARCQITENGNFDIGAIIQQPDETH